MSDERSNDAVLKLLGMLAERLDSYLEGDETALETLGESIEQGEFSPDDVQAAVIVLRSLGGVSGEAEFASITAVPGKHAMRVASAEERDLFTPEVWGYLLELRRNGSLDAGQFERVLELLGNSGVRPVDVEMACDVATRVALKFDETDTGREISHADLDLAH